MAAEATAETNLGFAAQGTCSCAHEHHEPTRIVVTGGPGAGKTAVLEIASRTFCRHVAIVPEAASLVFGGGFPRLASDPGRFAAQRAIFWVQRQLEDLADNCGEFAVALCDRGTVDGSAYWPDSLDSLDGESYWAACHTTKEREIDRYAAVIHLRTPPIHHGYNHENRLRTESAEEAGAIDERIEKVWAAHPKRIVIDSDRDFPIKAAKAIGAIGSLLPQCCGSQQ